MWLTQKIVSLSHPVGTPVYFFLKTMISVITFHILVWASMRIFTTHQRRCGKIMFSLAFVILSMRVGMPSFRSRLGRWAYQGCTRGYTRECVYQRGGGIPAEGKFQCWHAVVATEVGGMHPTGMFTFYIFKNLRKTVIFEENLLVHNYTY